YISRLIFIKRSSVIVSPFRNSLLGFNANKILRTRSSGIEQPDAIAPARIACLKCFYLQKIDATGILGNKRNSFWSVRTALTIDLSHYSGFAIRTTRQHVNSHVNSKLVDNRVCISLAAHFKFVIVIVPTANFAWDSDVGFELA